ncbi:Zinc finger C2H2-type domain-containing protein [Fasciola gigantica]|uniref:Zinc finger C2H2-type domain-containing protein n=1 Tax=Fasciola gigantica TaxID=46835 RepID=A0A504YYN0_FASGI|nr:Zinc finger C2H2-type domain-containing protein [Fasciola gigantica]
MTAQSRFALMPSDELVHTVHSPLILNLHLPVTPRDTSGGNGLELTTHFIASLILCWITVVDVHGSSPLSEYQTAAASCSRSESRTARAILHETVYPLFEFARLDFPISCPWNPVHDVFRIQEAVKVQNSARDWECQACGKRFVSEYTIDLHMTNRHTNLISRSPNVTCLANYCLLLRCEILSPDLAFGDQIYWDSALCEADKFRELRVQCLSVIDQCAPRSDPKYQRLREWLKTAVCDHLSCEQYWEVPDHRLETSVWYHLGIAFLILCGLLIYYGAIFVRFENYMQLVLSGDWKEAHLRRSAPPPDLLAYWKGIFSQPRHLDPRPVQRPSAVHWSVLNPILVREVSEALRQMIPTAPGLDRLTVRDLLQMDRGCIAQLLNALLVLGNPTQHLSMARITLVPKCSNATGPGNYHPIAVTSIVLRLLHKILARRWRNLLTFSPWQMAFLQRDGCSEVSSVLQFSGRFIKTAYLWPRSS